MNRSLFRLAALLSAIFTTSIAAANYYDPGHCHIHCWSGATAGPYWSTAESCCADFQALCGGVGEAYTDYSASTFPHQSRTYCPS